MDTEQLYSTNNFRIYRYEKSYYADRRMGYPRHYINYVARGRSRVVTENGTFETVTGALYYIPMGFAAEIYSWSEDYIQTHSCGFVLFPEARRKRFKYQRLPDHLIPEFLSIPLNRLPDTATLAAFYVFLEKVIPYLEEDETVVKAPLLEKLSALILQEPTARIPALAHKCDLAESTLYVHVKKLTGKTPNEYRMDVLMAEAIRLLASTDIPVSRISERLGFGSVIYFRQVLKKYTTLSPSRFRNRPKLDEFG